MKALLLLGLLLFPFMAQGLPKEFYETVKRSRTNPEKWPPVAYAAVLDRVDVVEFLLNQGEDINAETPGKKLYEAPPDRDKDDYSLNWYQKIDWDKWYLRGINPGYSPLELAVQAQNVEMICFLCAKGADAMRIHARVKKRHIFNKSFKGGYKLWNQSEYGKWQFEQHSALRDALASDNDTIIEILIHAYTDRERLYQDYALVQEAKNPAAMRCWIEKLETLSSGEIKHVPDDIVALFLSTTIEQAIQDCDIQSLELLLTYGLNVHESDFDFAVKQANDDIIDYLMSKRESFANFDPYDKMLKHGFENIVTMYLSDKALHACAKHNYQDLLKQGLEEGFEPTTEHLLLAVEHGSCDVVTFLCLHGVPLDGALVHAVEKRREAIVQLLLSFDIPHAELVKAHALCYELHTYDMFDCIDQVLRAQR